MFMRPAPPRPRERSSREIGGIGSDAARDSGSLSEDNSSGAKSFLRILQEIILSNFARIPTVTGSSKELFPLARRKDPKHLAVFRDRAAGDLDAVAFREHLHDLLVAHRILLVLGLDD